MSTLTLPLAPGAARTPRIDTARADHWAPRERATRATRAASDDSLRIEHWAAQATPAAAATAAPQPLGDPWLSLGHAHYRVVADEQSLSRTLRARWSAWRERRAQQRVEAEIRALAAIDPRVLRDLQVARDLAEWK